MSRPKVKNREFRSLANISDTGSTSRILNLCHVKLNASAEEAKTTQPFFKSAELNKSIIIKHALRPNERELFLKPASVATKIILPFDSRDLRLGGGAIFINEYGYKQAMEDVLGKEARHQYADDLNILQLIDTLPSLDPFILRECLARNGIHPSSAYFRISTSDIASMTAFASDEFSKLVRIALDENPAAASSRFVTKILSDKVDSELDPFRTTLRLNAKDFAEGLFSWRGFLYFKWQYLRLRDDLKKVLNEMLTYRTIGFRDPAMLEYIEKARPRVAHDVSAVFEAVGLMLSRYDEAFAALTERRDPNPFRTFLLKGPQMFYELGERVGVLSHINSFWAYHFGTLGGRRMSLLDFAEVLMDFEDSLRSVFIDVNTPPQKPEGISR